MGTHPGTRRRPAVAGRLGVLLFFFLAAVLTFTTHPAKASASTVPTVENRVGVLAPKLITAVGAPEHITAGRHPDRGPPQLRRAEGVCVAAETAGGLRSLSRADDFGIWPFRTLRADIQGSGLEAHHLIEQRFARVMGQNVGDMASIAVTRAEHQVFTNAWRAAIPYGPQGTRVATRMQVEDAARRIYADYPDILKALGL